MKKLRNIPTFVAVFILTVTFSLSAQTAPYFTGSLLWKISGNGLEKPSYIMGTHHAAGLSILNSINGLDGIMNDAEQMVGELLMSDQMALAMEIQKAAILPDEYDYKNMMTEEEYATLDSALIATVGVGMNQFQRMKPGMISMMFTLSIMKKAMPDVDMSVSMDGYFQQFAGNKRKPILGLETVQDQINVLFEAHPYEEQVRNLLCMLNHQDIQLNMARELNEYYAAADLKGIDDMMKKYKEMDNICPLVSSDDNFMNMLNKERNDKWLLKLPSIMNDKSNFIAVGALHITGEDGLLYQLHKMGYTVEAVK